MLSDKWHASSIPFCNGATTKSTLYIPHTLTLVSRFRCFILVIINEMKPMHSWSCFSGTFLLPSPGNLHLGLSLQYFGLLSENNFFKVYGVVERKEKRSLSIVWNAKTRDNRQSFAFAKLSMCNMSILGGYFKLHT